MYYIKNILINEHQKVPLHFFIGKISITLNVVKLMFVRDSKLNYFKLCPAINKNKVNMVIC